MKKPTYLFLFLSLLTLSHTTTQTMGPAPAYTPTADTWRTPKVVFGCVLIGSTIGGVAGMIDTENDFFDAALVALGILPAVYLGDIHARYSYPDLWRENPKLSRSCMMITGITALATTLLVSDIRKSLSDYLKKSLL